MTTITRQELYAQVWAEPMTKVATQYNVSSNYLARICEQLKVPRPPRGYWQQLAVGRAEGLPALPKLDPGDAEEWIRGGDWYARTPPPPIYAPVTTRGSRRGERPKTHPLLLDVREAFEDSKVASFRDDGYLKPKKHSLPDVFVSKDPLQAALRLANQLFLTLEDQGHWVRTAAPGLRYDIEAVEVQEGASNRAPNDEKRSWRAFPPTLVFMCGVAIGLTVFEVAEYVDVVYEDGKFVRAPTTRTFQKQRELEPWRLHKGFVPSGRLGLFAYSPYGGVKWSQYWREEKPGTLKGMLEGIGNDLEAAAPIIVQLYEEECRQADERDRQWQIQKQKWAEEEAERRRREHEEQRLKRLQEAIGDWRMARDIREYVAAQRALVEEAHLEIAEGRGLDRELKWALAYADKVDSLAPLRADIARAREEHEKTCARCASRAQEDQSERPDEGPAPGHVTDPSGRPEPTPG